MKKFTFRVYTGYDPEDGFWAWTIARTAAEAKEEIRHEYHSVIRVELFKEEKA